MSDTTKSKSVTGPHKESAPSKASAEPYESATRATMENKNKVLDATLSQISKQFGKGAIMRLGKAYADLSVETIPSGALPLDIALGIGGIPRGRVTELYGPESSGKTTLALHVVASAQKGGGTAAFIDVEHALDPLYAQKLGVNIDELLVSQPSTGEEALEIVDMLIRSGAVDVVVVDSVAALVPRAELEGEMGDSHVGLQAGSQVKLSMAGQTDIVGTNVGLVDSTTLLATFALGGVASGAWDLTVTLPGDVSSALSKGLTVLSPDDLGLNQDFEQGFGAWTAEGLWHLADTTTTPAFALAHSGVHSAWYGQDSTGNYDTGQENSGILLSPPFLVPANGQLSFWSWEQTESNESYDTRKVYVQRSDGTRVFLRKMNLNQSQWASYQEIDLSGYAGSVIRLAFVFDTIDQITNDLRGWFVDDILVAGATVPKLVVTPPSIDFGSVAPGSSTTRTVTLSNAGLEALSITNLSTSGGSFSLPSAPTFPLNIDPKGQTTLVVLFNPTVYGVMQGSLAIASNDPKNPNVTAYLHGRVPAPKVTVCPPSLNFQNTSPNSPVQQSLTISNTGSADLKIQELTLSANPAFSILTSFPLPLTLPPGSGAIVKVQFNPTAQGSYSATMTLVSDDPVRPVLTVNMTGQATTLPGIYSPPPGSCLTSTSVTFTWTPILGSMRYYLGVGAFPGGTQYAYNYVGSGTSTTVRGLPSDGRQLYVRLYYTRFGAWSWVDYRYTAMGGTPPPATARIVTPPPGSTLGGSSVTFSWTTAPGVSEYWLYVGASPGSKSYFGGSAGQSSSFTVDGLPRDGSTVYTRLWWRINGMWSFSDATFVANAGPTNPSIQSPPPGSTLTGPTLSLSWSAGELIDEYALLVGSSTGAGDFFDQSMGTNLAGTVDNLPTDGRTLYVRLKWRRGSTWSLADTTCHAQTLLSPTLTSPTPGSTLTGPTFTFSWSSGTAIDEYQLFVGSSVGVGDYFGQSVGTSLSQTINSLPTDGRILYARLKWRRGSTWSSNDTTYTAFNSANAEATMVTPSPGSTLPGSQVTFSWTGPGGGTPYWIQAGSAPGEKDYIYQNAGTSSSILLNGLPTRGTSLYVRLWWKALGVWKYKDYTYNTPTSIPVTLVPSLQTPKSGSTLPGSKVTFQWTPVQGGVAYWIFLGSFYGASNYGYYPLTNVSSLTVTNIPVTPGTVYMKIYYRKMMGWSTVNTSFKTGVPVGGP